MRIGESLALTAVAASTHEAMNTATAATIIVVARADRRASR